MKITELIHQKRLYMDGATGTVLQGIHGLTYEKTEDLCISAPKIIEDLHFSYLEAGADIICANTFGVSEPKDVDRRAIISAAFDCANAARGKYFEKYGACDKFIAYDMGPTGKIVGRRGNLSFDGAYEIYAECAKIAKECGFDLIFIETMNDLYEAKAALLGAKEGSTLPVMISFAFGEDGKLLTGADTETCVALAEAMGAVAVGINCSLGPKALIPSLRAILENASIPVIFKPNAGLPKEENGTTYFDVNKDEFSNQIKEAVIFGARAIGGCCGTTPEYIKALYEETRSLKAKDIIKKEKTVVSSYTHSVTFGYDPVLIGERINPTGKKRFKRAILEKDFSYILGEGVRQADKGAQVLDVNVGLPEICEKDFLCETVQKLQAVLDLPLQIDSSDADAMEKALRIYNGKALINSVNGKEESMRSIFPLVKKYGGVVICLTLDENGIPDKAVDRLAIAEKILNRAKDFGLDKKDLIFDPLALTISADPGAAKETLKAVKLISEKLCCHTSLGVSNISFGLPSRDVINATFFALALENGLSAAILNVDSDEMMKTYHAYRALKGLDQNFSSYIAFSDLKSENENKVIPESNEEITLLSAIEKGLSDKAKELCEKEIALSDPLSIVNEKIIPALNSVGEKFEQKKVYLPQLLMSAEAAKCAFEVIKSSLGEENKGAKKEKIVLATVKGDIHDIGKNIVKLLMENYGYHVIDLGKDVSCDLILDTVIKEKATLLGLSALMTTTVPYMEETIRLISEKAAFCKVMVGGAVLTEDYAKKIGADFYAKDAMEAVRILDRIFVE